VRARLHTSGLRILGLRLCSTLWPMVMSSALTGRRPDREADGIGLGASGHFFSPAAAIRAPAKADGRDGLGFRLLRPFSASLRTSSQLEPMARISPFADIGGYLVFQLAEVAVPRAPFAEVLHRINRLRPRPPPLPA
jgi:hypothetical protein